MRRPRVALWVSVALSFVGAKVDADAAAPVGTWEYRQRNVASPTGVDPEGDRLVIAQAGDQLVIAYFGLEREGEHGLYYTAVQATNVRRARGDLVEFTIPARNLYRTRPETLADAAGLEPAGVTSHPLSLTVERRGEALIVTCASRDSSCPESTMDFRRVPAETQVVLSPTHYQLEYDLDFDAEVLRGTSRIDLQNPSADTAHEASLLLYRLMGVVAVRDGHGRALAFRQATVAFDDFRKLQANHVVIQLPAPLRPGARTTIEVRFEGHLLGYAETGMLYVKDRIDRAFTILRPDSFAYPQPGYPSWAVNRSAPEWSFSYVARVTVPHGLIVANGGRLDGSEARGKTSTFQFSSLRQSSRMDFAIAPYSILTAGPVRVFHLPGDEIGAAGVARAAEQALALYAHWFGPRREAVPITLIEIPDGWGSQADVTTILQSAAAFKDPERHREVYHELSHLWDVPSIDRPSPRWNEGLASFLEYLVTQETSGTPVVDARANRLVAWLRTSVEEHPDWRTVPLVDYGRARLTDLSYSVGALYFDLLYRLVGPEAFRRIMGGFSARFGATGASIEDLVEWERTNSPFDLSELNRDWIFSTAWIDRVRASTSITDVESYYRRQGR